MKDIFVIFFIIFKTAACMYAEQWPLDRAKAWYQQQGWLVGCNFIPSTAENTIEMWQEETFDPKTIDIELGYAEGIGFNIMRVFLHYLVWQQDPVGFKQRLDAYLNIATSHKIKTMFVLFDDCWAAEALLGPQQPPIPGVHNSRWVQCPGDAEVTDVTVYPLLESYVTDVMDSFRNDSRVSIWDVYNEPTCNGHGLDAVTLLESVFRWARNVNVSQPITSAVAVFDDEFDKINILSIQNSDIITFHSYNDLIGFKSDYQWVLDRVDGRPCICSEYMARTLNCKFETHLPFMKSVNVGAINWGLVSGKTQTIYPWGSPPYSPPPKIWFHDILNKDGSPFNTTEVELIRNLTLHNNDISFNDFLYF